MCYQLSSSKNQETQNDVKKSNINDYLSELGLKLERMIALIQTKKGIYKMESINTDQAYFEEGKNNEKFYRPPKWLGLSNRFVQIEPESIEEFEAERLKHEREVERRKFEMEVARLRGKEIPAMGVRGKYNEAHEGSDESMDSLTEDFKQTSNKMRQEIKALELANQQKKEQEERDRMMGRVK